MDFIGVAGLTQPHFPQTPPLSLLRIEPTNILKGRTFAPCPETKKALTFVRAFLVGVAGLTQPHFPQTQP
ncbi:hypothetical protein SPHINGO8BC_140182 [Sphingobacterium multivorum]|uniref:Uncharacterized protein n=1 Tax=Sphingobacterium multivorum TaxID=28454 RepID=A0A653ZID5_SPHMU|nr:hypothetical protein SPHINGO8BC_140182 [Sphingobacterium multivorum]